MVYGRSSVVRGAAACGATAAVVQAGPGVALGRGDQYMDDVVAAGLDTHRVSTPDDTCLRRIRTCQILG